MSDNHSTSRISTDFDLADEEQVGEFVSGLLAPSDDPDIIGWLGNYRVQRVVGRGGMGIVLKAYDPSLYRVVAIKVVAPQLASNHKSRLRLINEARAAACINHPNIVTIYAIEEAKSLPYLVMEFVQGRTLQARLAKSPSLDYRSLLQLSSQIAAGLSAAHAHGVIHRDIKPGNILLEDGIERVKITDFGLAKVRMELADLTSVGNVVGTPAYLSPEQLTGSDIDHRSDQFSLGCVIYAMVLGHSPFHGPNPAAILHNVAHRTPVPLKQLCENIPSALSEIVGRMLQKDPDKRFDSTEDVSELLANLLVADYLQTPTVYLNESTLTLKLPPRRFRLKAAMTTALFLVSLLVLMFYFDLVGIRSHFVTSENRPRGNKEAPIEANPETSQKSLALNPSSNADSSAVTGIEKGIFKEKSQPAEPKVKLPTPPRDFEGDRRAAVWALNTGGTITIRTRDHQRQEITIPGALPAHDFALLKIRFPAAVDLAVGWDVLADAPELDHLYFAHVPLTDTSLQALCGLKELRYLSLQNTKVTDTGLEHLAQLTNLNILWLDKTEITDAGIPALKNLQALTGLGLSQTRITNKSLETVIRLENLRTLTLAETKITDDGIQTIEVLSTLEMLDLMNTEATDASVESLAKLQNLKTLNITGTQISSTGRSRLRKMLPNCQIQE